MPAAGKPIKPYQGLKLVLERTVLYLKSSAAGKPIKPYQGLKPIIKMLVPSKESKAGKPIKPYQGLKLHTLIYPVGVLLAGKPIKPYQGLKQKIRFDIVEIGKGRKTHKTLSGIETEPLP